VYQARHTVVNDNFHRHNPSFEIDWLGFDTWEQAKPFIGIYFREEPTTVEIELIT